MSLTTLTHALPIVAAAYGRKFNVPVQVGGDDACTDGKTIRIPQIHDNPEARILAYGYLAHEAAHIRFTDFERPRDPSPLGRFIEGVIEDVRIETEFASMFEKDTETDEVVTPSEKEAPQTEATSFFF